jgi:uncharacterized protein YcfJ
MTRYQILGMAALALLTLARDATAQRGGAVRSGARGAVVGGLVGGESGAATGAKVGVVTGAVRSVGQEAQARAQYQATPAYQSAPRSNFNQAPPAVLGTAAPAATAPPAAAVPPAATASSAEVILQKNGKPLVGVTLPADWKQATGPSYVSGVSADGQAYAMIATLDGAADNRAGVDKVKQGLLRYLQDIKYDDETETKRGALVVTGTGKGKKSGVDVVFAVGVMDAGARQIVGAAFLVDSRIEDYYKETIRQICQTVRIGDDFAPKK